VYCIGTSYFSIKSLFFEVSPDSFSVLSEIARRLVLPDDDTIQQNVFCDHWSPNFF